MEKENINGIYRIEIPYWRYKNVTTGEKYTFNPFTDKVMHSIININWLFFHHNYSS